jgi:hypothetical protein
MFENKEKITYDVAGNAVYKIDENQALPLDQYMGMYFQTPQGKEMFPSKSLPNGFPRGGNVPRVYTIDEAVSNPAVASEWERADPESYKAAVADYYSPAKITARAKIKK